MKKRMLIMLLIVAAVIGAIAALKIYNTRKNMAQMASSFSAPAVSTIKAMLEDWQPKLESVGSLRAVNGADLSAEVAGIVQTANFDSGTDVEKGAILVQLRVDDDIAKLHALEATAKLADITWQRDLKQLKVQAISQATADTDAAMLESDIVDKKTIKAPFAGHLGIRQIDVGQYLNPGTAIVTLQQLDPIYVDFTLPEQAMPKLVLNQKVSLHTDAYADTDFVGTITAINSKVDAATRNVQVRATLPNPDHKLLPGMFGNVTVDVDQPVKYITLPQTAIIFSTYGNAVYLVQKKEGGDEKDGDKPAQLIAQQSVIITGLTRGDQIAVLSGVKEGDEVVTSGQVKLRNGTPIIVNNDVQPSNDPDPSPHEQ
jgi:membrane fusion protein (multidrug efflux system)